MCGIVGGVGNISDSLMKDMLESMSHRGPDNQGSISIDGTVHLGHSRLSIIDLSSASNQPLWDVSGRACIVFNGEIYNYRELRDELASNGYSFTSNGDAEVLLNLYLHFGEDALSHLNGIFSFAIWDSEKNHLFLARDHFGVKPLYYVKNSEGFFFASEIKSLLKLPSVSREINYDAIFRSIVFLWSPGPKTILKQVKKLEPGSYLLVKNAEVVRCQEYWSWPEYNPIGDVESSKFSVISALDNSVADQLVSDVPLGAFLSGGLDSSLLVAMACKKSGKELPCFTIKSVEKGGDNDGFSDDLPYAKKVANTLGCPLTIVEATPDIVSDLRSMLYHLDEPQADPAPLNVSMICKKAKEMGVKVLLSGAGGDDVFSGYRRHYAIKSERYWSWLPKPVRSFLKAIAISLPKEDPRLRRLSKAFSYADFSGDERILSYFYWVNPEVVNSLMTPEVKSQLSDNPMKEILDSMKKVKSRDRLERMLYLERRYFMVDHNFNYTDKMSMAHSIEVRVPFLDARVASAAAKISSSDKQRGRQGKWILKKSAESFLPKDIIYRPKSGFGAPLRAWLKGELKGMVDDVLSEKSLKARGIFSYEKVRQLIIEDRAGKHDYSYPIFALLCLEIWMRIFIDGDESGVKL
ncbi:asparagine synthase (glutamine-hydrolyzing) [Porticoccus sp. GXU_MW_L64]